MVEDFRDSLRLAEIKVLHGGTHDWTEIYPSIFHDSDIPDGRFLDIGAYDGRFARWLQREGIQREVISLEIRKLSGIENMVRGSAVALPFADDSFENVVSFFALPYWCTDKESEQRVLSEMVRVASERVIFWPAFPQREYRIPQIPGITHAVRNIDPHDRKSSRAHVLTINKSQAKI